MRPRPLAVTRAAVRRTKRLGHLPAPGDAQGEGRRAVCSTLPSPAAPPPVKSLPSQREGRAQKAPRAEGAPRNLPPGRLGTCRRDNSGPSAKTISEPSARAEESSSLSRRSRRRPLPPTPAEESTRTRPDHRCRGPAPPMPAEESALSGASALAAHSPRRGRKAEGAHASQGEDFCSRRGDSPAGKKPSPARLPAAAQHSDVSPWRDGGFPLPFPRSLARKLPPLKWAKGRREASCMSAMRVLNVSRPPRRQERTKLWHTHCNSSSTASPWA